jgi:hypothetical protein
MFTMKQWAATALVVGLTVLGLDAPSANAQFYPGWTYRFYHIPPSGRRYSNLNPRYTAYIANYQANLAYANPFVRQALYQQAVNNYYNYQLSLAAAAAYSRPWYAPVYPYPAASVPITQLPGFTPYVSPYYFGNPYP